jgi:outer membrane protein
VVVLAGFATCSLNGNAQQLSLLDAVGATLQKNQALLQQRAQVDFAHGAYVQASGQFDTALNSTLNHSFLDFAPTVLTSSAGTPVPNSTEVENLTNFTASSNKLFRNGISVTPSFQLQRDNDSYVAPLGLNNELSSVTLTIPLLQGRGRAVVAAQETAAQQEVAAARLDLDFLLNRLVQTAADDYWNLVAAVKQLQVAISAEDRGRVYVDNTQALIDADHVPRSDINEVSANLAQRTATRIAAEQAVWEAREQVALDMGMDPQNLLTEARDPADDFPVPPSQVQPANDSGTLHALLAQGLTNRADYLAAKNRTGQSQLLQNAAANRLLPVLNLQVGAGYQGVRGGASFGDYLAGTYSNVRGPNVTGGLTYTFPLGNHAARGILEQSIATTRQAESRVTQTAQTIAQELVVAVQGVRNAILRVQKTNQAVDLSSTSVDDSKEKYRAGLGSIVEILQNEDRLTTALSDQVQARLAYAQAIVQLRFATGLLVPPGQATPTLTENSLTTLPANPTLGSEVNP